MRIDPNVAVQAVRDLAALYSDRDRVLALLERAEAAQGDALTEAVMDLAMQHPGLDALGVLGAADEPERSELLTALTADREQSVFVGELLRRLSRHEGVYRALCRAMPYSFQGAKQAL